MARSGARQALHDFADAGHAAAFEHADELRRVLVEAARPRAGSR